MHIFFHVPKAAGTTVREQIRLQIGAQKVLNLRGGGALSFLSDGTLNSMDLVSGHVGINLLQRIHVPFRALSFLRDPVQRVFSQYRYMRRLTETRRTMFRRSLFLESLETILNDQDHPIVESMFRNTQVWFFARDWDASNRDRSLSDTVVLDIAKENIQEKLDCFGLVEHFDTSFRLMNRCFNWNLLNDVTLNVSGMDSQELTPQLATLISEHNEIDVELYSWAEKLFHDRCEQWLGTEKKIISPNNFSGSGWRNGVRVGGASNTFYYLSPCNSELDVNPGDSIEFATTGTAKVLHVEVSQQNGSLSVFVTVDRPIDPMGDGFPNKVVVRSK